MDEKMKGWGLILTVRVVFFRGDCGDFAVNDIETMASL